MPDTTEAGRLRRCLQGTIVQQGDPGYDAARRVWNGMIDRKPAMIAFCAGAADVAAVVNFARSGEYRASVRAGGHNVAGCSVCDNGIVIDLSRMKGITVDPDQRIARADAGLTLGEFDAATQAFGLATTMGVMGGTGIAGLTLGGGFGRLGRKYGLACDNLIAAEVVTADGRLVTASAEQNADLFWGIRGGGGNFGIVTRFEYRLHPVGPDILHASLTYDRRHARDALRAYYRFSSGAPDEVSADAALATGPDGETIFNVSACYIDAGTEHRNAFERLLEPLTTEVAPLEVQMASRAYVDIQAAADDAFPSGDRYYWKAQFLKQITDEAIETLLEQFEAAPSSRSVAVLQHVGGAIARVPTPDTAYGQRDAGYDCFPVAIWTNPADDQANIRWARQFWSAVTPFSTGGVYVNNLGDEGVERVRAAYGENYQRLAALKCKYDPDNFFRSNQNIEPEPCR